MTNPTTMRLDDGLDALIRGCADASKNTDEIPALSQADVARILLRDAGARLVRGEIDAEAIAAETDPDVEPDDLRRLIPDHKIAKFEREEVKDQGWLADMKHGFEGRVRDELRKRFKRGYDPDGIEERAETWKAEARIYWDLLENDEETLQRKVGYVDKKVEEYREKFAVSDYDPDEEWLGFDGVEQGETQRAIENGELVDEIRSWIVTELGASSCETVTPSDARQAISQQDVVNLRDRLADDHDLEASEAMDMIENAAETFEAPDSPLSAAAEGGDRHD